MASPSSSPTSSSTTTIPSTNPSHPFYSLPPELILSIVDLLPPESFINFAFANYPLLHHNGLAPALSGSRVNYLTNPPTSATFSNTPQANYTTYLTTHTDLPSLFPLIRLPAEIMLSVMAYLKPIDVMRFVVANYQDLARQGIAPGLSEEVVRELRALVGREGAGVG